MNNKILVFFVRDEPAHFGQLCTSFVILRIARTCRRVCDTKMFHDYLMVSQSVSKWKVFNGNIEKVKPHPGLLIR